MKLLLLSALIAVSVRAQTPGSDRSPVDILERPSAAAPDSGGSAEVVLAGDERAEGRALAREVMEAAGGERAWNDLSWNLSFEFVSYREGKEAARFSHRWNRRTNAAVVSGTGRDGKRWEVRFGDLFARRGTAMLDGAPAHDSMVTRLLDNAYARFINDSYWLLMPLKLLDKGVNHRRLEDTTIGGRRYETLALSFEKVGLTPGDQYWLYIDPKTKRVARWRFLLQSGNTGEYTWEEYERVGPVTLPRVRRLANGQVAIRFENVKAGE